MEFDQFCNEVKAKDSEQVDASPVLLPNPRPVQSTPIPATPRKKNKLLPRLGKQALFLKKDTSGKDAASEKLLSPLGDQLQPHVPAPLHQAPALLPRPVPTLRAAHDRAASTPKRKPDLPVEKLSTQELKQRMTEFRNKISSRSTTKRSSAGNTVQPKPRITPISFPNPDRSANYLDSFNSLPPGQNKQRSFSSSGSGSSYSHSYGLDMDFSDLSSRLSRTRTLNSLPPRTPNYLTHKEAARYEYRPQSQQSNTKYSFD